MRPYRENYIDRPQYINQQFTFLTDKNFRITVNFPTLSKKRMAEYSLENHRIKKYRFDDLMDIS